MRAPRPPQPPPNPGWPPLSRGSRLGTAFVFGFWFTVEVEVGVRQCTEAEPAGERGGEQQACVVHEAVVVEGDVYPVRVTRC